MISYLLTSSREHRTIGRAMEAIIQSHINTSRRATQPQTPSLPQPAHGWMTEWELLVAAPDEETLAAARNVRDRFRHFAISLHRDEGRGKSAALNLLFSRAKGDIWVLTDGDVWIDEHAVEHLLSVLIASPPSPPGRGEMRREVGLVSGHPVPTNSRKTLLGFWAHVLTASADFKRRTLSSQGKYLDASGYLLAIRRECLGTPLNHSLPLLPPSLLVEDSYLSHLAYQNGYQVVYAPNALVHVKFPTTFSDWMKQKIRSTGGYAQIQTLFPRHVQMRAFGQEVREFFIPLKFIQSPQEFFWLLLLYGARLYLWIRIFLFYRLLKKSYVSGWPRIESTK